MLSYAKLKILTTALVPELFSTVMFFNIALAVMVLLRGLAYIAEPFPAADGRLI